MAHTPKRIRKAKKKAEASVRKSIKRMGGRRLRGETYDFPKEKKKKGQK